MLDVFFLTTKQFCLFLLFPLLKGSSGKYRVFFKWIISVMTSRHKHRFKIYWLLKKNFWGHWLCPFTIVLSNKICFLTPPNIKWKKKINSVTRNIAFMGRSLHGESNCPACDSLLCHRLLAWMWASHLIHFVPPPHCCEVKIH